MICSTVPAYTIFQLKPGDDGDRSVRDVSLKAVVMKRRLTMTLSASPMSRLRMGKARPAETVQESAIQEREVENFI